ncbi:MAG TPA: hypothetical protein VGN26_10805 [Armatimonadota bacterium]
MTYQVDTLCAQAPTYYTYTGRDKRQFDVIRDLAMGALRDHEAHCRKCRRLRDSGDGRGPDALVRQVRRYG